MRKSAALLSRRDLRLAIALVLAFGVLLSVHLGFPEDFYFDEQYYVSAARQFAHYGINENWSHPPLAKILIGWGLSLFGDNPVGWRAGGVLAGMLTVAGMYAWALALFGRARAALWCALLSALNQLVFVQSRIAMLDGYMMMFAAWSMASLAFALRERVPARRVGFVAASAALLGFAACCKWTPAVAWPVGAALLAMAAPRALRGRVGLAAAWSAPFVIAYGIGFVSCLGMTHPRYAPPLSSSAESGPPVHTFQLRPSAASSYQLRDLLKLQADMLGAQYRMHQRNRPYGSQSWGYNSEWWSWPLMARPIWYFSRTAIDEQERTYGEGIILLGNPLIMWGGLAALVAILASLWFGRSRARKPEERPWVEWQILGFYGVFVLCWAVLPRKTEFYYYYYPSGTILSLAITWVFCRLPERWARTLPWVFIGACVVLFVFFYPLLTGGLLTPEQLSHRVWLSSWV